MWLILLEESWVIRGMTLWLIVFDGHWKAEFRDASPRQQLDLFRARGGARCHAIHSAWSTKYHWQRFESHRSENWWHRMWRDLLIIRETPCSWCGWSVYIAPAIVLPRDWQVESQCLEPVPRFAKQTVFIILRILNLGSLLTGSSPHYWDPRTWGNSTVQRKVFNSFL